MSGKKTGEIFLTLTPTNHNVQLTYCISKVSNGLDSPTSPSQHQLSSQRSLYAYNQHVVFQQDC